MLKEEQIILTLLFITNLGILSNGARQYMEGACDANRGYKCATVNGKYDVTFTCNARSSWDVEFYLWQFRPVSTIKSFTIANCTNVTLNLQCTNEIRYINYVKVTNVTRLTIPSLYHGITHIPNEFILEDVQYIDRIPSKTFIQMKKFPYTRYGCQLAQNINFVKIHFRNTNIGTIEKDSFYNLTDFKSFTFQNVSVNKFESHAVQLFMDSENTGNEVSITESTFSVMEYLSFDIIGYKFVINSSKINEIKSSGIKMTVYDFYFINNSVGYVNPGSMVVLAKNVKLSDSNFNYLSEGSFKTIGPGLPQNALIGFGNLHFIYEFKNNLVESLEVASLHPDWKAYRKVWKTLIVSYNALQCTCGELAWLSIKEGFGKEFSALEEFHEKFLNLENKNICIDTPCTLPVDAVRMMVLKDGRCYHNYTPADLCDIYYPTTTRETTRPTVKVATLKTIKTTQAPNLQYLKRLKYGTVRSGGNINNFSIFKFLPILFYIFAL